MEYTWILFNDESCSQNILVMKEKFIIQINSLGGDIYSRYKELTSSSIRAIIMSLKHLHHATRISHSSADLSSHSRLHYNPYTLVTTGGGGFRRYGTVG